MKRFTSFLLSLLLVFVAMAQSETTTINVTPGDGSYNGTGWCSSWTSTSVDYPVTISVGVNNLYAATTSSGFQMARGQNADSDWTFSVAGYKVVSYSFKFKSNEDGKDVTLSATNADGSAVSMTSSYSTEQTFSIDCSNASTATFRISGSNNSIIATDLTLVVRPPLALTSLEVGQVYRFVNVLYPTYSLNANSATDVNSVATSETDTKQQWYVEKQDGEYYVLRNLAYGKFLKGNGQSSDWSMSDDYSHDYNKFKLYTSNTDYNTLHTNTLANYAYIHCNSSYNIVGWSNSTTDKGSHWAIKKVDYTTEQITALLEKAPTTAEVAAYPAALEAIFSDAACTILNSAYTTTSMTDEQLAADANYLALPQTLKNMVKKVRNDEWSEATIAPASRPNGNNNDNHNLWTVEDTWGHEYAKKFRVQMYEPYSVEGEITSFLGINAHCNMDNPTGIYANAGEPIYIMVEGDIAEGAELWVAHQTGHGVTNTYNNAAYTQLKKGLNVIPYASDGCQLWINYLVHTYNTSTGEFPYKLSDYKPLKIHIEGGHINGFFNAMGDFRSTEVTGDANGGENLWGEVDNDADWDYYKARAALATDFALLGHRQTLLFPFGTWDSTNGYFGVANDGGGIEKALAWHLENIEVPTYPNCYAGSGNALGNFSDTYYPGMNLVTNGTRNKINIMLEAWDRIMYSEHATMGLLSKSNIDKMNSLYPGWTAQNTTFDIYNYGSNDTGDTYKAFCEGRDYSDYYNHHGAAVGSGTGYMSGGWRVCNYHYNTMGSIIGKIAVEAGPTWGPAHEIGHQHQAIFNLNGQTEVTNNFFSNVAVWYMGMGTSRVNGTDGSLESVLGAFNTEDNDLYTNNIWAITHLYYRLWLYYHLAGNNTQFWPRLFELLRQTPMVNGGQISGETSLLRFYQHACDAAGEDLTEFFRAHGFFELMTNRFVGDYSNATYNVTEEQIETAITAVKENNYPVNYAVLLINDATSETTLKHDGTTKRALWDTDASAEYGSVNDFIEGNTSVTEAYTAIVGSDGTVTMSGSEGGVGFLVFNENGELVSFSNKSTFELSDEAKKTILQGNATFVAVDSKNNTTTAEIDLTAMQRTILAELIAMAQQIIDKIDYTYTKIGFYKGAAVADLAAALENAKTVYDAGTSGYGAAYDLLYAEYQKVLENPDARIPFDPSLTYIITNKAYTNETMWVNNELVVRSEGGVDQTADAAMWQFKPTATNGVYNIYNKKGYYCPAVTQSTAMTATTTANADALYTLQEMEAGVWAIKLSPAASLRNFHSSWSNVVGWEIGNDASRWYLTAVAPNATIADLTNLEVYITKTEALLGEVLGTVTYTPGENIALQTTTEGSAGYIWSNAPSSTEGSIANLVDGAINNYFHTDFSSEPPSGSHYIAVDLGAGNTLPRFAFSHTTRSGAQNDFPKSVDVYGSDDNVTYKYLGSASDMPQSAGAFWQFDGMIISSHRYLRFNMHASRGYWHMAEFDIMPVTSFTATVNDTYSGTVNVGTLTNALEALYNGKGVTLSMSPTEDNIDEKLQALRSAYEALYTEYSAAITARKNTLAELAANTQNLINQVGTVGFGSNVTKLTLTTENLYCNAPYIAQNNSDYSADYVSKLTDGSATTFLHTDYSGTIAAPHYLRVYLGENSTTKSFKFNYTTRDNGNNCPTTILIEGCNEADGTYTTITTLTAAANGLPNPEQNTSGGVAASFESPVITMGAAYKYVRFKVTGVEGGGATFFVISEFGFSTVEDQIAVNSKYKSVVSEELLLASVHSTNSSAAMSINDLVTSVPMLDAQIADQQAAYDKLNEAMQKATCDKTELQALYDEVSPYYTTAHELYASMADANGNVNADYAPSTLTNGQLATAKNALDNVQAELLAAQTVLDEATEQDDIDAAKVALNTVYEALKAPYAALLAVENANEKNTLATTELVTLIEQVETLLGTIATTGTSKGEIALQVGDANSEFYIWSNAPAGDCNGYSNKVEGLIDVNDDGSANTGTFFGTAWGAGAVAAYTHYLEVDLGVATSINKLSMDYTTRASGYENQRPTAIKILGSNNKIDYTEVTTIANGLATGECEQWAMETPLELGARYRYIRFAVATQEDTGYFNMSDFNLYSISDKVLNDYYSTADTDLNALLLALEVANDALTRHYLTTAQYTAIKDKLNSVYNDVNSVIALDYTTRNGLTTLIDDTEALIDKVATVTEVPAVTLTEGILYCNADNKTNSSAGTSDKLGVAALLDGKVSTFLHTTYGNNQQDDNEHHYIRVDLGEGSTIKAFKFSYTGRENITRNSPTAITVQAANDVNGTWENIQELTDMQIVAEQTATYQSPLIEMSEAYRYVRIMVTSTYGENGEGGATTTYDDVSHPFFVMSEFDFVSYPIVEVKDGYTNVTAELVGDAYLEKSSATEAKNHYMLEADYTAAQEALQAAYDALNAAAVADKTELEELIAATTALKSQLYKQAYTQGDALTLQADNAEQAYYLYCNAPESNAPSDADNVGVSALIDNDETNYLHTEWTGQQSADGLDHYLRVDLGEDGKLSDFVFSYKSARNLPRTFVVEGSNTADGEYERIGLYVGANTTNTLITSDLLSNGNEYRYLRFRVIETHGGGKDNSGYHYFFVLNDFDVYPATVTGVSSELKDEYASTIYIYTTSDLVTEVTNGITQAQGVVDNADANQGTVDAEVEALQAVYDKLEEALKYAGLPVTITTDEANPVLYKIISKRADDDSKVLQFDEPTTNKVAIVATADNASYQAWYFMKGDNGYLIKPFNGDGKMLGVSSTGDAQASASIAETPTYKEWDFSRSTVTGCTDYFYIYVHDTGHACLSHNGGFDATDKLGIWASGWNTNDGGTLFKFVEAEFDNDNARYYQLSDFENTLEYRTAITPEGTTVGAFVNGEAYSTAYTTASDLITAGNTSDATACKDAYTALRAASADVEQILPEEGKIYRIYITPGLTDSRAGASMRIDDNAKLACGVYDAADAHYYFTFEYDDDGNLYMKNLHSATYLDEALAHNANVQVGADAEAIANAKKIAINTLGKSGDAVVVGIVPDGGAMLNCAAKEGNVVAYDNTAVDKASAWVIEEVEPTTLEENVEHIVTLGNNTVGNDRATAYSSLCLGYPVTLPADADVVAYTVTTVPALESVVELTSIAGPGETIPANTPVILKGTTANGTTCTLSFTAPTNAVATVDAQTNQLGGTTYAKYLSCFEGDENVYNIYMLTRKNGLMAMRWVYENYRLNGDGTYSKVADTSNDGGYVLCPANKAYLKLGGGASLSAEYFFSFFDTTDIDTVEGEENPLDGTIYDLQGRKIGEVTTAGFYIVNGEKVYVNPEMLK